MCKGKTGSDKGARRDVAIFRRDRNRCNFFVSLDSFTCPREGKKNLKTRLLVDFQFSHSQYFKL